MIFNASEPLSQTFRDAVAATLGDALVARRADIAGLDAALGPLIDLVTPLALGGKHFRPAFLWWAHIAVAGEPADPGPLLALASSLDLIHAGLLAHDDLIDSAPTRRGKASVHAAASGLASPPNEALGSAAAIIGGLLLIQWGERLAQQSGLLSAKAQAGLDELLNRVLTGQLADAWASAGLDLTGPRGDRPLSTAQMVAEIDDLKAASYTVVGPVTLGALAGEADAGQLAALERFAWPVGRAFQARDDVLAVFGDEARTGKPSGNDLRQGKLTALVESALTMADEAGLATLRGVLGDVNASDENVARARDVIASCGALSAVEKDIADAVSEGCQALDDAALRADGKAGLIALANAAADRNS